MPARQKGRGSYSPAQKQAAVMLAVFYSTRDAHAQTGIPERSIHNWVEEAGGMAELTSRVGEFTEHSVYRAVAAISTAVEARAAGMSTEELSTLFLKVLEVRRAAAMSGASTAPAAAVAAIHIAVDGKHGSETLDLPVASVASVRDVAQIEDGSGAGRPVLCASCHAPIPGPLREHTCS